MITLSNALEDVHSKQLVLDICIFGSHQWLNCYRNIGNIFVLPNPPPPSVLSPINS